MSDPVEVVRAGLARSDRVFWLDGGGARDWSGSRSLVGVLGDDDVSLAYDAARGEVTRHAGGRSEVVGDDVFAVLEAELARDAGDPRVHWVGWLGYAARPDLTARPWGRGPDAVWLRCTDVQFFQHPVGGAAAGPAGPFETPRSSAPQGPESRASASGPVPGSRASASGPVPGSRASASDRAPESRASASVRVPEVRAPASLEGPPSWYAEAFAEVQRQLRAGNSYEVNLTYREQLEAGDDPLATYLRLRAANPAPYAGMLSHRGTHLLSSSPERYATVGADRWLETKPIKGTTPRGADPVEDARLAQHLATDPKCRAENLMIVDLLRNDLSMVCDVGTVAVPHLMEVESYAAVHQLVSTVRGRLRDDVSTVAALRALFPAGSMTGAPKRRTMEVVDAVEGRPRGPYAGAFGWICADGRADLGVVIRSLLGAPDGTWWLGTGGGVTVRSDVAGEWAESRWKAERLLVAARRVT